MKRLEKLIKNDGTVIDCYGYAEEGVGIFDDDGNRYPAGYASDGMLFACEVDGDGTILNTYGDRMEGITSGTIF